MFSEVLIIDPSPAYSRSLATRLRNRGMQVTLAGRTSIGEEELKVNRKRPFDLIILDIDQPDALDIQPVIKLRHLTSLPILVLGEYIDPVIMFRCLYAGALDFVEKSLITHDPELDKILLLLEHRAKIWNNLSN